MEKYSHKEKNRGRIEKRIIKVYQSNLNPKNKKKWGSVASIIEVKRVVTIKNQTSEEIAYFISD